jgi:MoCo/4Fe-4S cofactor protein with predicted Tat translocation signal
MQIDDSKQPGAPLEGAAGPHIAPEAVCPEKLVQMRAAEASAPARQDLLELGEKLAGRDGVKYWRSLEELAGTEEFRRALHREFPRGASEWLDPVSRRGFLKLMGASLALAGLTSCVKQPLEPIVPYVRQPDELVLGMPLFYATAMTMGGYAYPQLVRSHEGNPDNIQGNPEHPMSLGGSDIFSQAAILSLYDPDRAETHLYQGEIQPWLSLLGAIRSLVAAQKSVGGAGLRFLTRAVSSPTLAAQMRGILQEFPQAKWYQWEPCNRDNVRAGAQMAFGENVETRYNLLEASIILSLDADIFAGSYPGNHRYARDYAARRRPSENFPRHADGKGNPMPSRPMNRLYMLESTPTITGAKADHKLQLRAGEIEHYVRLMASRLGIHASGGASPQNAYEQKFIDGLLKDLQAHRGSVAVIAGDEQPAVVHALAHAMNEVLGGVGKTVIYTDPVLVNPTDQAAGMRELAADMKAGKVEVLVILGGNPVYDAPADVDFAAAMQKVTAGAIYHGLYFNETSALCNWHANATHYLEAWSDARAVDGSVSIVQPLIAPLYGGKSEHELLAAFTNNPEQSGYEIVRSYWRSQFRGAPEEFEGWWRKAVHDGFIAGSALPPKTPKVRMQAFPPSQNPARSQGIEITLRPDPSIHDGSWANNAWLQELPKPMTKVTWDNPVLVGPAMAKRLGLQYGDVIEITAPDGRKVKGAVWIQPGQPDHSITVFLGYGRTRAGRAGNGFGFNAYPLRTVAMPWIIPGAQIRKTGEFYKLISTQGAQDMENRHVVRAANLQEFEKDPEFAHRHEEEPPPQDTLYPNYQYTGYAWGMSIDQNACVGCNACIVACQSENNIPVVGKAEVARGRHMHWLRVDSYYQGDPGNPRVYFQPVPCMHCENAPCELVCPVAATVHDSEGLNDMVYNRCVGTRYCSNNCPYKVRRFNFLLFQDWNIPQYKMMRNPEVSVRSRGVMEKCTYCVQRITKGRIAAEREDRVIRDLEVQTACQQACPADAIVFGNLNDKHSRVSRLKQIPLDYGLLAGLNTRPRTTYLAIVRNPNPEIPEPEPERAQAAFRVKAERES